MPWTSVPGRRRSVSRVPGAPPRTSTPPTAPFSQRTTVQPVAARRSVQCPTRMPGTSVMASRSGRLTMRPPFAAGGRGSSGWHFGQKWLLRPATFTLAISRPQT